MPPAEAMLDRIDRRVRAFRHPVATYLAFALAGGLIAATALVALIAILGRAADGALLRADVALLHAIPAGRPAAWLDAALDVTALGNTLTLAVLLAWAAGGLWITGRRLPAVVVTIGFAAGRLVTELLKAAFDRPRPEILEWGTHVTSASFPSAHAMSAAVAYGSLAYLVSWYRAPTAVRVAAWAFSGALVAAIAASRVYLGVHYPSDVVAGILAGAVWAACVLSTLPASRRLASAETRQNACATREGRS